MIAQFLAITWIVFAGLAWIIAKTKARNPWTWLGLGILLGPLAAFALVMLPKIRGINTHKRSLRAGAANSDTFTGVAQDLRSCRQNQ